MKQRGLAKPLLTIAGFALAVSIILPVLNRRRQRFDGITPVGSHLHQIGIGLLLYCEDHKGCFPDSLATMVIQEKVPPEILIDPGTDDTPAKESTPEQLAAELKAPGHQSFIYLGAGLNEKGADANLVVVYEPLSVNKTGADALFGDGHCEWLTPEKLKSALSRTPTTQATTNP